ncbi:MAG: carbohydrate porin [Nitrospinae bacterium]|nr:carbohydrate porin [Nitrospinota bacterium]
MKRLIHILAAAVLIFSDESSGADEKAGSKNQTYGSEFEDLKHRVEELEKRIKDGEAVDELGHKLHPIHSIYGLKISGGLTMTAQGTDYKNNKGAGAISADIVIESPLGKDGRVISVLDFQRGAGLQNLPSFLTSPNGNATGPNNDIESFDNDQLHVAQFYYEHNIVSSLVVSVGQLDPTVFFDINLYANNERVHFLANQFANNPTIEFGASENFYGPGIRLTYSPAELLDITVATFEGDGNYADIFENPFLMAEADFKIKPFDKDGIYRVYYWSRKARPNLTNVANPNDATLINKENSGAGLSIEQLITDTVGIWLRGGIHNEKVAQFDRHFSGGLNIRGEMINRPNDVIGLGYGMTSMGKDYKDYKTSSSTGFSSDTEQYMELYYNISIGEAAQFKGFHISPDVQYVINPGGDANASKLFIYGIRLQAFF